MKFNPKKFVVEQVKNGRTIEEAIFLLGFKSAIDSVGDMNEGSVVQKLNLVWNKLLSQ